MSAMDAEDVVLTCTPDTFDLYVDGDNHTDLTIGWTSPEQIYFVNITDLTEMVDYEVTGNTVRLKVSYLSTLSVGGHEITFNFMNDLSEPIVVKKVITVIDTTPVCSVTPLTAVFDRDPVSVGYADLVFAVSGEDFVEITGLTLGTHYTFSENTVTILKEYLQTLPLRDKSFGFRFGDGSGIFVTATVSIMDSRCPPLSVDGIPVSAGSGTGWTYSNHVLTINSDAHTLSGYSDTDTVVISNSVTSVVLSDLQLSTTNDNALTFKGNSTTTLTMQMQGTNRLESQSYGVYASYSGSFMLLGSGSLTTSGIYGNSVTVRAGTIQVNDSSSSYGIYACDGNLIISGGTITSIRQGSSYQYALAAKNDIVISDGTISATAEGTYPCCLLASNGKVDISGGTINATSRASDASSNVYVGGHGLRGQNVAISGGRIDIDVSSTGGGSSNATGIYAGENGGNITISGGTISVNARASSGNSSNTASGIHAGDGSSIINIYGGSIHVQTDSSGNQNKDYGLRCSQGNITMDGGSVTADGSNGICAHVGNIIINGGTISTDAVFYGLVATSGSITIDNATVVANGGAKGLFGYTGISITDSVAAVTFVNGTPVIEGSMYFTGGYHEYTLANQPAVDTDLLLPKDNTFTIPSGFTVQMLNGSKLKVAGTLINNGTITGLVAEADGSPYKVRNIAISKTEADLISGDVLQLTASTSPNFAANQAVTWSSSNESVAAVSADGSVTALSPGQATITASAQDDGGAAATCTVTVIKYAASITLNMNDTVVYTGETAELEATVMPEDTSDKSVTWSTSDNTIATVDSHGTVTAQKAGSAVIRATANDGSGVFAQCQVTVKQYVTGITLNLTEAVIYTGGTATLKATVLPSDASNKSITWSSSDESTATVDASGKVTALKIGSVLITATANDGSGAYAQCQITVKQHVTAINLNTSNAVLYTGDTVSLEAAVLPDDASDKSFTWSTSNTSIATVNLSGTVTAKKAGSAFIRATANDGSGIYAACAVTVKQRAAGITLSAVSITLNLGKTTNLSANVQPADTSDKSVTWSTSNGSVVSVDAMGKISGLKEGTADITATTKDGSGLSSVCRVTVIRRYATGITLNASSITLYPGYTTGLKATVMPDDTYDKSIQWSSSNLSVATVSSAGKVSAVKPGIALITATATDGSGTKTSCVVTVLTPISSVTLSYDVVTIAVGQTIKTVTASVLPANASKKALQWISSKPGIATVNGNGYITGTSVGVAYITASAQDGSAKKDTVTVYVVAAKKGVTGITLNKPSAIIDEGKTLSLSAKLTPKSPQNKTIIWTSSNLTVATVDGKGKVTAKTPGTTVITATASSGVSARCTVTVNSLAVSKVVLKKSYLEVDEGKSTSASASVLPKNARFKTITWSSSNPSIATVSPKGKISTFRPGTVQIIATAHNGVSSSCTLIVRSLAVSKVVLKKGYLEVDEGKSSSVSASVLPKNARYKTITWTSSNPSIATVSSKGKITTYKPGTVQIIATAHNGKSSTCTLVVRSLAVTSVSLTKTGLLLKTGRTATLKAYLSPKNARYKSVSWTTSDPKIATVSTSGIIKAVSPGTATITATSHNGITAACTVHVE